MENWDDFFKRFKKEYYETKYIRCPAFNSELVYFTHDGFNHLIYKEKKPRDLEEQTRRFNLFKFAKEILRTSKKFNTYKHLISKRLVKVYYWSFMKYIHGRRMTVIVRQIGEGEKHFFSIFDTT